MHWWKSVVVVGLSASAAFAKTVTWRGGTEGDWDLTAPNWVDANGEPAKFANGDDVVFDRSFDPRATRLTVFLSANVQPKTVTADADGFDLVLTNRTDSRIGANETLVKRGDGTLYMTPGQGRQLNTSTNDIRLQAGRIVATGANNNNILGRTTRTTPWTIDIGPDAELWPSDRNILGSVNANGSCVTVVVRDGGVFNLTENGVFNIQTVSALDLRGGEVRLPHLSHTDGALYIVDRLSAAGSRPSAIEPPPYLRPSSVDWIMLGTNVVFDVADVTGDCEADFTSFVPFVQDNVPHTGLPKTLGVEHFRIRKCGPGTMRYAAGTPIAHNGLRNGTVQGFDLCIGEGELRVDGDLAGLHSLAVDPLSYLSGTGTVGTVTLADGAGLRANVWQRNPLVVTGDLTAGTSIRVDIAVPPGLDAANVRAQVLRVEGTVVGGENLASATVTVNGEPVKGLTLRFDGHVLSVVRTSPTDDLLLVDDAAERTVTIDDTSAYDRVVFDSDGFRLTGAGSLAVRTALAVFSGRQTVEVPVCLAESAAFHVADGAALDLRAPVSCAEATDLRVRGGFADTFEKSGAGLLTVDAEDWTVPTTVVSEGALAWTRNQSAGEVRVTGGELSLVGEMTRLRVRRLDARGGTLAVDPGDVIEVSEELSVRDAKVRWSVPPTEPTPFLVLKGGMTDEVRQSVRMLELANDLGPGRRLRFAFAYDARTDRTTVAAAVNRVVFWTGGEDGSGDWDRTTANWADADGVPTTFADNDDVVFDSRFNGTATDITVRIADRDLAVNTVTVDADGFDLSLVSEASGMRIAENTAIFKRGDGTLTLRTSGGALNLSDNRIVVEAGRIDACGSNNTEILGAVTRRNVCAEVRDGGELWVRDRNLLGSTANGSRFGVTVCRGGTFNLRSTDNFNIQTVRAIDVERDGTFKPSDWGHSSGILFLLERFSYDGEAPFAFEKPDGFRGGQPSIQIGTNVEFRVADVTGDAAADLTVRVPMVYNPDYETNAAKYAAWFNSVTNFGYTKTGPGKMLVDSAAATVGNCRPLNGNLIVQEGELEYVQPFTTDPYVPRTVRVSTNAVLRLPAHPFQNPELVTSNAYGLVTEVDHGTLVLDSKGTKSHIAFGDLLLDNATLDYSNWTPHDQLGLFTFHGRVVFRGGNPYVLPASASQANDKVLLGHFPAPTEFWVDELTGDASPDVEIGHLLHEQRDMTKKFWAPGSFVKTGPGTLLLSNDYSTYSGNVEVREGVLLVGRDLSSASIPQSGGNANHSPLGSFAAAAYGNGPAYGNGRTVTVRPGAELHIYNRNMFGTQQGITNASLVGTLIVDGGLLRTGKDQGFILPNLTFRNGGRLAWGTGASGYGRFMVTERFRVDGDKPFEWMLTDASVNAAAAQGLSLNGYPENVFEIEDVTGDAAADATFGVPFIVGYGFFRKDTAAGKHRLSDWKFGFTKRGAGTMRYTAARYEKKSTGLPGGYEWCGYNGDTKVEEGTLEMDGDISASDTVRVKAGAYLGGYGTVNNVTLADGAGLRVREMQAGRLTVKGRLVLEGRVNIDIVSPAGRMRKGWKFDGQMLDVEGEIVGAENLANAVFTRNGEPVRGMRVEVSADGRFDAGASNGFVLTIRGEGDPSGGWAAKRAAAVNRPRAVVYNTDGCDMLYYPSNLAVTAGNFTSRRLVRALGTPITTISYCPQSAGFGHFTCRKAGEPMLGNVPNAGNYNAAPAFFAIGTYALEMATDFARTNGFEVFVSIRVNDQHDGSSTLDDISALYPQFKLEHPECLMGAIERTSARRNELYSGYAGWSCVDFGCTLVRDRMRQFVRELVENYDVDGIEYDFNRHFMLFRSVATGGVASEEEVAEMTRLMRDLKAITEAAGRRKSRPIVVFIRTPDGLDYARAVGADLETWFREKLVDAWIGGGYFRLNPWPESIAVARQYGIRFFASLDESRIPNQTDRLIPGRMTDEFYAARVSAAQTADCDGVYLFNAEGSSLQRYANLVLPEVLATTEKVYFACEVGSGGYTPNHWLNDGDRFDNMPRIDPGKPRQMAKDETYAFDMFLGGEVADVSEATVQILTGLAEGKVGLTVNGVPHDAGEAHEGLFTLVVPSAALRPGMNSFAVTFPAAAAFNDFAIRLPCVPARNGVE